MPLKTAPIMEILFECNQNDEELYIMRFKKNWLPFIYENREEVADFLYDMADSIRNGLYYIPEEPKEPELPDIE